MSPACPHAWSAPCSRRLLPSSSEVCTATVAHVSSCRGNDVERAHSPAETSREPGPTLRESYGLFLAHEIERQHGVECWKKDW